MFEKARENLKYHPLEICINLIDFEARHLTSSWRGASKTHIEGDTYLYNSVPTTVDSKNIPKSVLSRFGFIDDSIFKAGLIVSCLAKKNSFGDIIPNSKGIISTVQFILRRNNGKDLYLVYNTIENDGRRSIISTISYESGDKVISDNFVPNPDLMPQGGILFREAMYISNLLQSIRDDSQIIS